MIGSGKTTIGKGLAKTLQLDFYDLDQEMDRILGHSFHKLVEEKGWVAFRELEYSICKGFTQLKNSIICLGGGTVRYEWNRDVLKGTGVIILLTAATEELIRRVKLFNRKVSERRPQILTNSDNSNSSCERLFHQLDQLWHCFTQSNHDA